MTIKDIKKYIKKEDLNLIEHSVSINQPLLLVGETGTGKTTIINEIAKLNKKELIRVSINGQTGTEEILGKYVLDENKNMKWIDGVLTDAVRTGKWIVFDEINAASAEILFALHQLLDNDRQLVLPEKNNEVIPAHKDFRFFASMNPEDYQGTKVMNMAFLSRFLLTEINPLVKTQERNLILEKKKITKKSKVDLDLIKLVKFAEKARQKKKSEEITFFVSTRDIELAVDLLKNGMDLKNAFNYAIWNKIGIDDREELEDLVKTELDIELMEKDINEFEALEQKIDELKKEKLKLSKEVKKSVDIINKAKEKEQELLNKENELNQKIADTDKEIEKKLLERLKTLAKVKYYER